MEIERHIKKARERQRDRNRNREEGRNRDIKTIKRGKERKKLQEKNTCATRMFVSINLSTQFLKKTLYLNIILYGRNKYTFCRKLLRNKLT